VLNMWYDADIDAVMNPHRDAGQFPAARSPGSRRLSLDSFLAVFAVVVLALATNLAAARTVGLHHPLLYCRVYGVAERTTRQNIVIGGAAGALPPVIGWAAATRRRRARAAYAVPHYLPLDAAPFLGSRAQSHR